MKRAAIPFLLLFIAELSFSNAEESNYSGLFPAEHTSAFIMTGQDFRQGFEEGFFELSFEMRWQKILGFGFAEKVALPFLKLGVPVLGGMEFDLLVGPFYVGVDTFSPITTGLDYSVQNFTRATTGIEILFFDETSVKLPVNIGISYLLNSKTLSNFQLSAMSYSLSVGLGIGKPKME